MVFNGTNDSYQPNLSQTELETMRVSVDLGANLMLTAAAIESPIVEHISNIYGCLVDAASCAATLSIPGSAAPYTNASESNELLTFYRGDEDGMEEFLSYATRSKNLEYSQSLIDSSDLDDLFLKHAHNSARPPSPFVSVTSDIRVATHFAEQAENGAVYEVSIPSNLAKFNQYNDFYIEWRGLKLPENEWLVPNHIPKNSIIKRLSIK